MKKQLKKSKLKICATCKWIFKEENKCPKCNNSVGFYSAFYAIGYKTYNYKYTQDL